MPLIPAKCPECGGLVEVDSEKRAGLCQHCGQPFVVEDAIQTFNTYYQTTNNYNTTHNYGDGAVVNVYEDKNKDFVIEAGALKKYHGESADVVIPDNVVKIDSGCFDHLLIKSIYIPASVRHIDENAFTVWDYSSPVDSIIVDKENKCFVVDSGVLICQNDKTIIKAINSLVNYVVPNNIVRINSYAFANCKMLKAIIIPESVETIGYSCFENCESLSSIKLPGKLNKIDSGMFENCKSLKNISIPKSVENIYCGFEGCNLDFIKIERNYYLHGEIYNNIKRLIIPSSMFFAADMYRLNTYEHFKEIEVIYDGYISKNALGYHFECLLKSNKLVGSSKKRIEEEIKKMKSKKWRKNNRCQYCGERFYQPFLGKPKCSICGRKKDY